MIKMTLNLSLKDLNLPKITKMTHNARVDRRVPSAVNTTYSWFVWGRLVYIFFRGKILALCKENKIF